MTKKFILTITMGAKQYLRNPLFIILLVILPPTFISLSFIVTPDFPLPLSVLEGGKQTTQPVGMAKFHGALMVPITVSFLSGILGMFVMLSARQGDRRLVNAGYNPNLLLVVRLAMITIMSLVITLLAVGVTLISFQPEQLGWFFFTNLIVAVQYGFIGAIVGTFLSAMSGTYLIFFLPFLDVGGVQNPMFSQENITWWVKLLPGYAPMEILVDVSFSPQLDTGTLLLIALAYTLVITLVAGILFHRVVAIHR